MKFPDSSNFSQIVSSQSLLKTVAKGAVKRQQLSAGACDHPVMLNLFSSASRKAALGKRVILMLGKTVHNERVKCIPSLPPSSGSVQMCTAHHLYFNVWGGGGEICYLLTGVLCHI